MHRRGREERWEETYVEPQHCFSIRSLMQTAGLYASAPMLEALAKLCWESKPNPHPQ